MPQVATPLADDALAARLHTYLDLLRTQAPPAETAAFLAENPVWPNRPVLRARLGDALRADPDDAEVAGICARFPPEAAAPLLRCAVAERAAGSPRRAGLDAAAAWAAGIDADDPPAETQFLADWPTAVTPGTNLARFRTLDAAPATRDAARSTAARLDPPHRALAGALLDLQDGTPDPLATARAVPAPFADDPLLALETARRLRLAGDLPQAATWWRETADRAELSASAGLAPRFAAERNALARALLAPPQDQPATALALLDEAPATTDDEGRAGNLFLAGTIALLRLHDPAAAEARFSALSHATPSLITRARAAFWLARTARARNDAPAELADLRAAARYPTTFYGQQALARLHADPSPSPAAQADAATPFLTSLRAALAALPEPDPNDPAFAAGDLPRAARLLVAWHQPRRAPAFLALADRDAATPTAHATAAATALELDLPQEAVSIARLAGRDGLALPDQGWPAPIEPPPGLPPGLVLGLVRQESGFDPEARSPHGALGLTQLLPATAAELARARALPTDPAALTADPELNLRLGSLYLAHLLARAGGVQPLAIAAYNAGPGRLAAWSLTDPPPAAPTQADPWLIPDPMIDWIERIPAEETRNYVQRVLADSAIYASRAHVTGIVADTGALAPVVR